MSWQFYALLSAAAAGATAVLAKVGVQAVPSNLATAIRTVVILVFAWAIVIARGEHHVWGRLHLDPYRGTGTWGILGHGPRNGQR